MLVDKDFMGESIQYVADEIAFHSMQTANYPC